MTNKNYELIAEGIKRSLNMVDDSPVLSSQRKLTHRNAIINTMVIMAQVFKTHDKHFDYRKFVTECNK